MLATAAPLFVRASPSADSRSVVYAQSHFDAMGTSVHLIVGGIFPGEGVPDSSTVKNPAFDQLNYARLRIEELESCLSRFLPDSELSQLNRLAGFPTVVSTQLFDFVAAAWQARELTGGSFDPTIGTALIKLGYERTFTEIKSRDQPSTTKDGYIQGGPSHDALPEAEDRFEVDARCRTVSCSADVRLDLGGIAKGLTADIITEELVKMGAVGASINIGGDVRVQGLGPQDDGSWAINLTQPGAEGERLINLAAGGVCTSAITERRWPSAAGPAHHIVDPETGQSVKTDLLSVSVVGRSAAAAEVLATAALVDGQAGAVERIRSNGATGLVVTAAGDVIELPGFDRFTVAQQSGGAA